MLYVYPRTPKLIAWPKYLVEEPGFHGFLKGSMVEVIHTLGRSHDREGPISSALPMSNHWMNYAASLDFQIKPIQIYLLSLLDEVQL